MTEQPQTKSRRKRSPRSAPTVEAFRSNTGKVLYRVSTPTNSKRLIFDAAELLKLGEQINQVLGGTLVQRDRS